MPTLRRLPLLVALFLCLGAAATEPTVKKEDLPRVPPTEPRDAIKTMKVRPGFHVELAAAEPNVIDPIAMCFDENGRMFVVEMRDYSERRNEKLGRIRMLEDRDGDGVYETSTVFLDHLPWPTALFPHKGGILIGACPDILYAKDTTGDGVADRVDRIFTGFGNTQDRLNVQGLFNNFIWGLDNRIHGCSGHDGGLVERVPAPGSPAAANLRSGNSRGTDTDAPTTQPLDVRSKGFVIDPRDWTMTTEAGGGQYGLSFDPAGRLFTCENSSHCEMFMYDARYGARNPYATLPDPLISIAADGPAAEVFRASPEEPWRVIRTRWRVAGLVGGPVEGGGRSAGYFTGATGLTIYRGDAFGPDYVGDGFVGDAGGNLVHHKRIRPGPDGIEPIAQRPPDEKAIEFLASTDNWFRPVDFANAPDGCLYVCDMYRETIEHPWSLPPQIKQFLDLNSGNDRGRIYRIAPDGYKLRPPPKLGSATTAELVSTLEHPNGWNRETASRLLFERQDDAAVPLLADLLTNSKQPYARMHALHVLDGLNALTQAHVVSALADADPVVREHAVALSEKFMPEGAPSKALWEKLSGLASDPNPRVRYQLALTLGEVKQPERTPALLAIVKHDAASKWVRAAVLSSSGDAGGRALFLACCNDADFAATDPGRTFLQQLAESIGTRHDAGDIAAVAGFIESDKSGSLRLPVARALAEGAARAGAADAVRPALRGLTQQAAAVAQDAHAPTADRAQAIALLPFAPDPSAALLPLLADKSQTVQLATLAALDRAGASGLATAVLDRWPGFSPRVRSEAVGFLIKRPARATTLLDAIQAGRVKQSELSSTQVNFLQHHAVPTVRAAAGKILKAAASRESVIENFRPAVSLTGDAARGHAVYQRLCISCHRAGSEGSQLGPDFVTIKNSGREKLLLNILDPNREVAPQYVSYLIETKDGQSLLGILSSDTPAALTVRQAYGRETVVPRATIKRMTSQGKSLMPEELEEGMKPQDFADLMTFIEGVK